MNDVTMNRPDVDMANKIKAVFGDDPEIELNLITSPSQTYGCSKLCLDVKNSKKAAAISKMLPKKYDLSLPLEIIVKDTSNINGEDIEAAFEGNPHFKQYIEITNPVTMQTYHVCIFKEEVIKFLNDNGGSLHGYEFRLMEDLAGEVLDVTSLIYTTDDGLSIDPENNFLTSTDE